MSNNYDMACTSANASARFNGVCQIILEKRVQIPSAGLFAIFIKPWYISFVCSDPAIRIPQLSPVLYLEY